MTEEIEAIFKKLNSEVTDMHYRWNMYRDVYAGDAEQVALLNKSGSNFFYYVQHLMLDHMALGFSKLTDPNKQGRGNYENLSLKQIHVYASDLGDIELVAKLKKTFEELIGNCEIFRTLRNKRIAHASLDHAMGYSDKALPGISRKYVETALESLRKYMNIVELHYFNQGTAYQLIMESGQTGGAALISALRRAK